MTTFAIHGIVIPGLSWLRPQDCPESGWLIMLMLAWLVILVSLVAMAAVVELKNRKQAVNKKYLRKAA